MKIVELDIPKSATERYRQTEAMEILRQFHGGAISMTQARDAILALPAASALPTRDNRSPDDGA